MAVNYGKNISSINTPIKFHLPDGSSQSFKTSEEAQKWFDQNYKDGYSMIQYVPTYGDSEHPIELDEVVVTAPAPSKPINSQSRRGIDMFAGANYSPSFNKRFYGTSDFDALFGKSRVEGVRKAWQRNPQAMQNWADGGNAATAFITTPFVAYAAGEYALPWLAENVAPYLSAREWIGATQAASNTPAWLTPTSATAIDATLAGSATGVSINDMRENGPTVGNVLGTALGVGGLAYEAAPTIIEGYTAARNAVRPTIVGMKMRTMPLGEVGTPTLTPQMRYRLGEWYGFRGRTPGVQSTTNDWDQAVIAVQNRPFVKAYNQWNRFGYPEVPRGMISDTPKLESFVKGQLNRHNTFSRGVQVMPSEKQALEQQLGIKLSDDEFLRIAATTPRQEGEAGQAGLWISPRTDYTSIYGGGKTALVRRPFKLGPDRMQWFKEASFNVQHNPGGEGQYTDIMAPWNTQPALNWNGIPKYSVSTIPESELLSPTRMEFVDFVKGSQHMNNRTSLNSNPFFTKGQNHFDRESGQWVIDTYKRGGKLENEKH